jgi:DNA-binding transcriptional regulator YiaG
MTEIRRITVWRSPAFERYAPSLLGYDGMEEFVDFIAANPLDGAVITGTGGVRKGRWARPGTGKRGGSRILYYYHDDDNPIGLITIYGKGDKDSLTADEKAEFRKLTANIKKQIAAKRKATHSSATHQPIPQPPPLPRIQNMARNIAREALDGLKEFSDHIAGKPTKGRTTIVNIPADIDVRAVRKLTGLSQEEFARTYAIPIHTLRKWEQKTRKPDQASRVYLTTIARDPEAIMKLLAMA